MAASKSRLGRGLGGLIANASVKKAEAAPKSGAAPAAHATAASSAPAAHNAAAAPATAPQVGGLPGFIEIALAQIIPSPSQARKTIAPEALSELAESIRAEGLLQPIVVRKHGDKYELIAGERRWRAFQLLKIKTIPARLTTASDTSAATLGLIENLQREALNPIEEAYGFASLIRDFNLTQDVAAERVGKNRATVANSLRLLTLDDELKGYIAKNMLSTGHAKVLLGVEEPAQRALLGRRVIADGLSVRATEKLVLTHKETRAAGKTAAAVTPTPGKNADAAAVASIEKKLTSHFGSRVAVQHTPKRGKIVIEYAGNSDLQRILEKLGVEA